MRISFTDQRLTAHGGLAVWTRFITERGLRDQLRTVLPHAPVPMLTIRPARRWGLSGVSSAAPTSSRGSRIWRTIRRWPRSAASWQCRVNRRYKADFLEKFAALPPGRLEQIEKLEQLRVLEAGYPIAIAVTDDPTIGVAGPEEAKKFEALLE